MINIWLLRHQIDNYLLIRKESSLEFLNGCLLATPTN